MLGAQEAAQFLSSSKLPRKTLHDIWCLADSDNKGNLTIDEYTIVRVGIWAIWSCCRFYQACRLVAHAQNGAGEMTEDLLTVGTTEDSYVVSMSSDRFPL